MRTVSVAPGAMALTKMFREANSRAESASPSSSKETIEPNRVICCFAIGSASGFRVMRAVGVESEMELAFAALQQLCAPILDRLDRLPGPQRDALGVAFGLREGDAPDRFLVGLAVQKSDQKSVVS